MQRQRLPEKRFAELCVQMLGDDPEHDQVRVVEPHDSWLEPGTPARLPAQVGHRMMTRVAVEEDQLGKDAITAAFWIRHQIDDPPDSHSLTNGPDLHTVINCFAPGIVVVDLEMGRLERGKGVELERHPRVTGAHHAVRNKLLLIAEMAG